MQLSGLRKQPCRACLKSEQPLLVYAVALGWRSALPVRLAAHNGRLGSPVSLRKGGRLLPGDRPYRWTIKLCLLIGTGFWPIVLQAILGLRRTITGTRIVKEYSLQEWVRLAILCVLICALLAAIWQCWRLLERAAPRLVKLDKKHEANASFSCMRATTSGKSEEAAVKGAPHEVSLGSLLMHRLHLVGQLP